MGWFEKQIRQRKDLDQQLLEESFLRAAEAVLGEKTAVKISYVTQAIKAQKTIIDAVQNGDLEAFNPDNIKSYTQRNWFENHFATLDSSIPGELDDLQRELFGSYKDPECVISNYERFAAGGRKEYINNGNENTELVFSTRTVSAEKNIFESIFKSKA